LRYSRLFEAFAIGCALLLSPQAIGAEECIMPVDSKPLLAKELPDLQGMLLRKAKRLNADYTHLIDLSFLLDVKKTPERIEVSNFHQSLNLSSTELITMIQLYTMATIPAYASNWFGLPETSFPQTYEDYLKFVRRSAGALSNEAKLSLLSSLGKKASDGYDFGAGFRETGAEAVFLNMRSGGEKGGVCRDIHAFISQVADALGFRAVGTHSGISGVAHVVAHYVDPKTGEFYVQNYDQIINTRQKRLDQAVDVSTQIMNPLTGTSYVESRPGKMHLYQPRNSRWVSSLIEESADFRPDQSLLNVTIGNREDRIAAEVSKRSGGAAVKAFFLNSRYRAEEGPYELTAVGLSASNGASKMLVNGIVDEIGYLAKGYAGFLSIEDPLLLSGRVGDTRQEQKAFVGLNIMGAARIDKLTGKLEVRANMIDIGMPVVKNGLVNLSAPQHELIAGLKHRTTPWMSIEAARTYQIGPKTTTDISPVLRTAYDKINVIVDSRSALRKVYIVNETGAYLMEGVDELSAVGLKNRIKAAVPAAKLGEFSVIYDIGTMVSNASKDPFYEVPGAQSVRLLWEKAFRRFRTGVEVGYATAERPFFLFEQPGMVTPELSNQKKGNGWARFMINVPF